MGWAASSTEASGVATVLCRRPRASVNAARGRSARSASWSAWRSLRAASREGVKFSSGTHDAGAKGPVGVGARALARALLPRDRTRRLRTMYRPGDHVIPQDLPRRFVCRVVEAENLRLRAGICQVLKLGPLEGAWGPGTDPSCSARQMPAA